jgi:hypothetical protein
MLQSSEPNMGALRVAENGQALLRNCIGMNVTIDPSVAEGKLGIVDSQFLPPLPAGVKTLQPPNCYESIADQRMCDPRAACTSRPSGGVECRCKGTGIKPPTGLHDDGSRCATVFSLKSEVAAPAVRFGLVKPGKHPDPLKLHAIATGDAGFNATYSRKTVLHRDGSAVAQSVDGLHAQVFGLSFEWNAPQPTSKASIALDAAKQQYSDTIEHTFTLALQCAPMRPPNETDVPDNNGTTCPQDGDTIETTIYITPQAGNATPSVPTAVQIVTEVQAVISCECTEPTVRVVANTDLDSVLPNAPLSVHLLAMDTDDQPIRFTRAELLLTWDGVAVPFDWLRGLSEYGWKIPPGRDAGEHEIIVSLRNSNCTLLRVRVTVASDTAQLIVAGCIAGAAILVLVTVGFLVWKNRHRALELIFSLLSYEGVLTGELCLEVWYGCHSRTNPRSSAALCLLLCAV